MRHSSRNQHLAGEAVSSGAPRFMRVVASTSFRCHPAYPKFLPSPFPFPSFIRTVMRPFLFAALALPLTAVAQVPPASRLDSIFAPYQGTDRPGCAVAVSRNGDLIVARGYGMADLSQGTTI